MYIYMYKHTQTHTHTNKQTNIRVCECVKIIFKNPNGNKITYGTLPNLSTQHVPVPKETEGFQW